MVGRYIVASAALLAALAFLLLFASSSNVEAVTYKMGYNTGMSCDGPDGVYGTGDDSCVEDATYGAYGAGLNADLVTYFDVWDVDPKYSQYEMLATMGTPSTWQIATDKEIPNGAFIGNMVAISTLALFGGLCTTTLEVTIPMYDCSTDITDTIAWDEAISGANLTYGHEGGLPAGCLQYPEHVKAIVGDVQPRARYYGFTKVLATMPPTQLNFLMFNPGELTSEPAPKADFSDDLGYINFTVLDNPKVPAEPDSALDELCTPLGTTTSLHGLTAGEGGLDVDVFAPEDIPDVAGIFWNVGDDCGDGVDNDANTRIDELCGIVRVANPGQPTAGASPETGAQCGNGINDDSGDDTVIDDGCPTGIYGTGSHMAGGYSESYRDEDGDTICNNHDECPYDVDDGADADGDHIDDVCDTVDDTGCTLCDQDGDGWRNQADNCPLVFQTSQANDADDDGIGEACDTDSGTQTPPNGDGIGDGPYVNDFEWSSICIEAADTDGDGWCDATESLLESAPNDDTSVPEYYGIDWVVNAADNPPGAAPQSCDNWTSYDVNSVNAHGGVAPEIDDDGDTVVNAAERGCIVHHWCLRNLDEDGDTVVNDGCPALDAPEDPTSQCLDSVDDDGDTNVNDGCPACGVPEDPSCVNDIDDDGDTNVNDGCAAKDAPEDPSCVDAIDNGEDAVADGVVNDGCPAKGSIPENAQVIDGYVDVDGDAAVPPDPGDDLAALAGHEIIDGLVDINDDTLVDDTDDGTWTGTGYDVIDGYVDIDGDAAVPPDTDDDGFLDTLCTDAVDDDGDTRVNDGCPAVLVSEADADQCAEESGAAVDDDADTRINDGCPAKDAPEAPDCVNDIDDDGDTKVNDGCPAKETAEQTGDCENDVDDDADTAVNDGCPAHVDSEDLPDSDGDGEADGSDNCLSVRNPTQLDSDRDGKGDACDPDDDADKINDTIEWADGTDPKNVCDPRNFDLTGNNVIDILDVLTFKDPLAATWVDRPCFPPDDYSICEGTYRSDP